jgi:hypothetical protein
MEADLHPQAFGQILNRIWVLLRAHWRVFLGIAVVPFTLLLPFYALLLGMILYTTRLTRAGLTPTAGIVICLGILVGAVLLLAAMALFALYEAAGSYAALQADAGIAVGFREAYGEAWRKAGRYLWLAILRQLIVMAPFLVLGALIGVCASLFAIAQGHANPGMEFVVLPLIVLFYLVGIVWVVLVLIHLALSFPACVAEDLTAWEAVKRSYRLTRGGKLRIFLVALVIYAISYAAIFALELVFFILAAAGAGMFTLLHLGRMTAYTGAGFLGICFLCFLLFAISGIYAAYSTAFAVLYRDHRRLEAGPAVAPGVAG